MNATDNQLLTSLVVQLQTATTSTTQYEGLRERITQTGSSK